MIRTEICKKVTELGRYGRRTLSYSLIEDGPDEEIPITEYGVGVRVEESGEEFLARRFTADREEAFAALDLFATNFVTPISLQYVVEDYIER